MTVIFCFSSKGTLEAVNISGLRGHCMRVLIKRNSCHGFFLIGYFLGTFCNHPIQTATVTFREVYIATSSSASVPVCYTVSHFINPPNSVAYSCTADVT